MKTWLIIVPILVAVVATGTAAYYVRESSIMNAATLCGDPDHINSHVYNPARLQDRKSVG